MKVLLVDKTDGVLSLAWLAWAHAMRLRGYRVIAATSWDDAIDRLPEGITELQVIGHGGPAMSFMGGKALTSKHLASLRKFLAPGALVWFRQCLVFWGKNGQAFARHVALELGCRVAGHTRIIGLVDNLRLFASGLYVAHPGGPTDWPMESGNPRDFKSSRKQPRTIFASALKFPSEWLTAA